MLSEKGKSQTTYLTDTAFTTDIGFGGAPASCKAPNMEYTGWQMTRAQNVWIADAFTIPTGSAWTFDTVIIYGYQYQSGIVSTFLDCNLQIYNGIPGLGGSVIWGDTSTNVLVATGWTGIYRVDTVASHGGLTSQNRPIMFLKLLLSPAPTLSSGTYWLSWSSQGSIINATTDAPQKVLPGRVNPTGQTARQFYNNNWVYINDSGNTVGMNKIIKRSSNLNVSNTQETKFIILEQNEPNPFASITTIPFYLRQAGKIKIEVYNTVGQFITTLIDMFVSAGEQRVKFDAKGLPPGYYYYRIITSEFSESKRMLLVN